MQAVQSVELPLLMMSYVSVTTLVSLGTKWMCLRRGRKPQAFVNVFFVLFLCGYIMLHVIIYKEC